MAYREKMSSSNPGCMIIMIDQSISMNDSYGNNGDKKKDIAALAVNRFINETIEASSDSEGIKDRCFMGVIGYGTKSPGVDLILGDMICQVAENPIRVEQVKRKISDGAGGLVEIYEEFPVWVESVAEWGTPMDYAFQKVTDLAQEWCDSHPDSFPPLVVNIVGSKPNDMSNTRVEAEKLLAINNNDGNVLLFHTYLDDGEKEAVILPNNRNILNTSLSKFLFDISSELPDRSRHEAKKVYEVVNINAKGLICNESAECFLRLINFGATSIAR